MKGKDFFTKLKKDGKITAPEFDALIEATPEFEMPDAGIDAFETAFLTIERAATDKAVNTRIRREALDAIDRDLHEMVDVDLKDYVNPDKRESLKKNQNTYEKIKSLSSIVTEVLKKSKSGQPTDEDTKKKIKVLEETNQDLLSRIEKANNEIAEKEKFYEKQSEEKINSYRKDSELEKLAKSIKLASEFEKARDHITKSILGEIKATNNLALAETDGQTTIQVLDKEGKPRFNGNSAVTINQLLEEGFKPFIKQNNAGDGGDQGGEGGHSGQETNRFKVPDGKPQIRQGVRTTVG